MYKNKRLLAIIPARGGSKGIRLKNLRKINGISLIGHIGKLVKKIKFIDLSLVSSDHPRMGSLRTSQPSSCTANCLASPTSVDKNGVPAKSASRNTVGPASE